MGQSRTENILENILGASNPLGEPQSREESLLMQLLDKLDVNAMKWIGITSTAIEDGDTTNPITIGGKSVTAVTGDTVSYNSIEFVFNGTAWQKFGDLNHYTDVTGTLEAGQTSITLSSSAITTTSTIDVYTDSDIDYGTISVSTGSVTITFDEQDADLGVKVRVS